MLLCELFEGYNKQSEPTAVFNMPTTIFVSRKETPTAETRIDNIAAWAAENGINMSLMRLVLNPLNAAHGNPIKGWRFRLPGQPPLGDYRAKDRPARGLKQGKYSVQKVGSDLAPKVVGIAQLRQWAKDNEISTAALVQAVNRKKPVRDGLEREWMITLA